MKRVNDKIVMEPCSTPGAFGSILAVFFAFHYALIHWGLVTPYDDLELGQHWLR